jgi:hypothetical protein
MHPTITIELAHIKQQELITEARRTRCLARIRSGRRRTVDRETRRV